MKNIIPFKKDVTFKTNLSDITSISLENTLGINNDTVSGEFIISGEYKVSDNSTTVEPFLFKLPFEISIDDRFDTKGAIVDIDDFYYEILNNNTLSISIDVLIDKLQEKPLIEVDDLVENKTEVVTLESEDDNMERDGIFEEIDKQEDVEVKEEQDDKEELVEEKINSLFSQNFSDNDLYVTYNIFILRDGDTIDSVIDKYGVSLEELEKYNDLSNLKLGDKIIIPNIYEED